MNPSTEMKTETEPSAKGGRGHTPTPWLWDGIEIRNDKYEWVMEPEVSCGTWCQGGMVRLQISDANAAFIVKAVNSHDSLLAQRDALLGACKEAAERLEMLEWDANKNLDYILDPLRAAIAKAENEGRD